MRKLWRSGRKFIYQRLLHADDSPHRIALGVAIGLFAGFLPILGAQMVMTIAIAALLRANKAAGVPMVFVTNPVTFVPIYGFCWWIGSLITGATPASRAHAISRLQECGLDLFQGFFQLEFWTGLLRLMVDLGIALWIGCAIIGLGAGVVGYFLTRWGVTVYRTRRREKLERRNQRRLERREARVRSRQALPTGDFV